MNWKTISKLNSEDLKKIQSKKFNYLMKHVIPYHPFYRRLFQEKKLNCYDFKTIDNIEKMPFTSKIDILPTQDNPKRPIDFVLQPDENLIKKYAPKTILIKIILQKILHLDYQKAIKNEFKPVHIHFTTGRSSAQIPFLYTTRDLQKLDETGKRFFDIIGATEDDVVVSAFPFAPHLAFWLGLHASRVNNLLNLQTGGGKILGTQKIIEAVEQMKATIFIALPGFGYHLLKEAVEQNKDFSSLRIIVLGGERVSPALREKMKELLKKLNNNKVKILSTYASTEAKTAWVQCHEESGYHLYPDMEYIFLIDEGGKKVKEGEAGEIVYTALGWRGSVVLKYKTGDICKSLITKPCEFCGRTIPRLDYDIERKSEKIEINFKKIKGEMVNLNSFYTLIHQVKGIDEWQVEITKVNNDPFDLDELLVHVSLEDNYEQKEVIHELGQLLKNHTAISPKIIVHEKKSMIDLLGLEDSLKEKRIIDNRKNF